jgi:hypothetical protein
LLRERTDRTHADSILDPEERHSPLEATIGEMILGPWTHRIVNALRKGPLVARPVSHSKEAGAPTLEGPTPGRTSWHRAWGQVWRSLTREDGRVGREPLEWIPCPALD